MLKPPVARSCSSLTGLRSTPLAITAQGRARTQETSHTTVIAFVTREVNTDGTLVLIFRRGTEILGYPLILQRITMLSDRADRRIIILTVATPDDCMPPIYLSFEDDKRRLHYLLRLSLSKKTVPIAPLHLVCARLSPPPALALNLSLHRHPYLYIPPSSRFIRAHKQQEHR